MKIRKQQVLGLGLVLALMVAGCATTPHSYSVSTEGVITDGTTGLEWVVGPDEGITYDRAETWIKNNNIAGGGWRMPTLPEIANLYAFKGPGRCKSNPTFKTTGWVVYGKPITQSEAWATIFSLGLHFTKRRDPWEDDSRDAMFFNFSRCVIDKDYRDTYDFGGRARVFGVRSTKK